MITLSQQKQIEKLENSQEIGTIKRETRPKQNRGTLRAIDRSRKQKTRQIMRDLKMEGQVGNDIRTFYTTIKRLWGYTKRGVAFGKTCETFIAQDPQVVARLVNQTAILAGKYIMAEINLIEVFADVLTLINCIAASKMQSIFVNGISTIITWMKELRPTRTSPQQLPQGGRMMEGNSGSETGIFSTEDGASWLPVVAGGATLIATIMAGVTVNANKEATKAFKQWAEFGKNLGFLKTGFKTMIELVRLVVEMVSDFYSKSVTMKHVSQLDAVARKYDVMEPTQFVKETNFYLLPSETLDQILTSQDWESIQLLRTQMHKLRQLSLDGKWPERTPGLSELQRHMARFEKFLEDNSQMLLASKNPNRRSPFVVEFFGAAGVGKSDSAMQLVKNIGHPSWAHAQYDQNKLYYAYNPGLKHMDGYTGQPIVLMDDSSQTCGGTPAESEYVNMIRMVSEVPFIVPKADVHTKGLPFSSEIIIKTTNVPVPTPAEIKFHTALWRRRNVLVEMRTSEDFNIYDPLGGVSPSESTGKPVMHILKSPFPFRAFKKGDELKNLKFVDLLHYSSELLKLWRVKVLAVDRPIIVRENEQSMETTTTPTLKSEEVEKVTLPKPGKEEQVCYNKGLPTTEKMEGNCGARKSKVCCMAHVASRYFVCGRELKVKCGKKEYYIWHSRVPKRVIQSLLEDGVFESILPMRQGCKKAGVKLSAELAVRAIRKCLKPKPCSDRFGGEETVQYGKREQFGVPMWGPIVAPKREDHAAIHSMYCDGKEVLEIRTLEPELDMSTFFLEDFGSTVDASEMEGNNGFDFGDLFNFSKYSEQFDGVQPSIWSRMWDSTVELWDEYRFEFTLGRVLAILGVVLSMGLVWAIARDANTYTVPIKQVDSLVRQLPEWAQEDARITLTRYAHDVVIEHAKKQARESIPTDRFEVVGNFQSGDLQTKRYRKKRLDISGNIGLSETIDGVQNHIIGNLCHYVDTKGNCAHLFGLKGQYVIMVKHCFDLSKGEEITLKRLIGNVWSEMKTKLPVEASPLKRNGKETDLVLVKLDILQQFKDVVHHFVREQDLPRLQHVQAELVQRILGKSHVVQTHRATAHLHVEEREATPKTGANSHVIDFYRAGIAGEAGRCGAPMMHLTTACNARILGVHVAGNTKDSPCAESWIQVITREMITDVEGQVGIEARGLNEYLGEVDPQLRQVPPKGTKLRKSKVFEELHPTVVGPPVLSIRDPRISVEAASGDSPLQKGIDKFSVPARDWSQAAHVFAMATVGAILSLCQPRNGSKENLNEAQMLNGVPEMNFPAVNMSTSPGLPYKVKAKNHGKYAFLERINDFLYYKEGLGEELAENVREMDEEIREGNVPDYLGFENLKDEKRKMEKILNADTRTFDCLPLDVSLLTRKYFGKWVATMQQHCANKPISVGIATNSFDWAKLHMRLNRFGGKVIAGDYKKWDGKLMPTVMENCCELINDWYNDEEADKRARRALVQSFIHTKLVVLSSIIQKHQGIPSGVAITAPFNSLCNLYYICAAIYELSVDAGEVISPNDVVNGIEIAVYGDDHIIAPNEDFRRFLTFRNFRKKMLEHGIGYTDAAKKEDADFDFQDLGEVTYLKRRFALDPKYPLLVFSPLDMVSIEETTNWIKDNGDQLSPWEMTYLNLETYLEEMFMHGPQMYEVGRKRVNALIEKYYDEAEAAGYELAKFTSPYELLLEKFRRNYNS